VAAQRPFHRGKLPPDDDALRASGTKRSALFLPMHLLIAATFRYTVKQIITILV
jgi:hypothetical protein